MIYFISYLEISHKYLNHFQHFSADFRLTNVSLMTQSTKIGTKQQGKNARKYRFFSAENRRNTQKNGQSEVDCPFVAEV